MKKDSLGVYECPEAEEVTLNIESRFLGGVSSEDPSCPVYHPDCNNESDFCMDIAKGR